MTQLIATSFTDGRPRRNSAKDISLDRTGGLGSDTRTTLFRASVTDGTTLWFCRRDGRAYAYNATTLARDSSKDISLPRFEGDSGAVWFGATSDGTTLWFLRRQFSRSGGVYAYNAATRVRDPSKDFAITLDGEFSLLYHNNTIWTVRNYSNQADALAYDINSIILTPRSTTVVDTDFSLQSSTIFRNLEIRSDGLIKINLSGDFNDDFEEMGFITVVIGNYTLPIFINNIDITNPYEFYPTNRADVIAFYNVTQNLPSNTLSSIGLFLRQAIYYIGQIPITKKYIGDVEVTKRYQATNILFEAD